MAEPNKPVWVIVGFFDGKMIDPFVFAHEEDASLKFEAIRLWHEENPDHKLLMRLYNIVPVPEGVEPPDRQFHLDK